MGEYYTVKIEGEYYAEKVVIEPYSNKEKKVLFNDMNGDDMSLTKDKEWAEYYVKALNEDNKL